MSFDFNECIEKYGKDVYSFCLYMTKNSHDADDLYQQTFLVAIEKNMIDEEKNPKAYLLAIAANIWGNHKRKYLWRKKKADIQLVEHDKLVEVPAEDEGIEGQIIRREQAKELRDLVDQLPDKMKSVLLMYYMEEMSIEEIAEMLGIPEGTVKSRLHSAKSKLKISLSGAAKIAVIAIAIIGISSVTAYAAYPYISEFIHKIFETEHSVSVGNPAYINDEALLENDPVEEEELGHVEGDSSVKWKYKDISMVSGTYKNTDYTYDNYADACEDAGLDMWFDESFKECEAVTYTLVEGDGTTTKIVDTHFSYGSGSFHLNESVMTGNVAEDMTYSYPLYNKSNPRKYTSKKGVEFSLIDDTYEFEGEETTFTIVVIAYDQIRGNLAFRGMSEDEIHQVLDELLVDNLY